VLLKHSNLVKKSTLRKYVTRILVQTSSEKNIDSMCQEEPSPCRRIEQACFRFQGTSFSFTTCTTIFHSMQGLPLETVLVLLAQPSIYCSEIFVHCIRSFGVWHNVLGPRIQNVSYSWLMYG